MANFIYIARHAWAGSFGDGLWSDDSLRELEPAGAERYVRVVERLAKRGFAPSAIATSPYARCRQTADIIADCTRHSPEIVELEALTPGSDFESLCRWSHEYSEQSVCWVGHAPDVGNLTAALIGDVHAEIRFAKGAIAAVRLHSPAEYNCGELYWHATAKLLGL